MEVAITTLLVAVVVVMLFQRGHTLAISTPAEALVLADDEVADLPCPWCRSQTREEDAACPSCGQPFG